MKTLKITGADVWLGPLRGWQRVDVLCRDSVIEEVGPGIAATADRVVNGISKWLIPGVIDAHVHFREPGSTSYKEDLATGSLAAAAGGVTTFFEMPNTDPPAITAEAIRDRQKLAAEKSLVNFAFFIGATNDNVKELNAAPGVAGIKLFMGASTGDLLVHEQFALELIFGATDPARIIALHCEDEARLRERAAQFAGRSDPLAHSLVRDSETAWSATARALELANRHKHRAHILHVSTKEEVGLLANRGPYVTAEVAPHHLAFSVDDYARHGGLLKMNPPLREKADNAALLEGLRTGAIDMIATDHAPHTLEEKSRPAVWNVPSGIPSVENALGVMMRFVRRGICAREQIVRWMCERPAEVYGLKRKGRVARGMDADLVLFDPEHKHMVRHAEQFSKCKWSPWDYEHFHGWPVMTVVGGVVAFERTRVAEIPNMECRGRNAF
jgi:dihydroorotase